MPNPPARLNRRLLITAGLGGLILLLAVASFFFVRENDNDLTVLRVGYMKIAECVPLLNERVFASHGLRLDLQEATGGAVILNSLIGGGLDIGFSNMVSPLLARAQGIDLISIAGCTYEDARHPRHALMARDPQLQPTPSSLAGKTIAVNTLRNIDHLLLSHWLRKHDIDPKTVRLIEIPFYRMDSILQNKEVDAVAIVEPFLTRARLAGHHPLADYYATSQTAQIEVTSFFAKQEWAKPNRELVARFRAALREANAESIADESQFRASIAHLSGLDNDVASRMTLPQFADSPTIQGVQFFIDLMLIEGFLEKKLDPHELLRE